MSRKNKSVVSLNRKQRDIWDFFKFVGPMLILYFIFFILPLFQTVEYSFTSYNGINPKKHFIGFENYKTLFKDDLFYSTLSFTGKSALLLMIFGNLIGFFLALALNRKIKSRNALRAIIFCPFIFNNVTVGFIWQFLLGRFMTDLYPMTGMKVFNIGWLSNPKLVLYSVVFVKIWQSMGYFMAIYLAGLQLLPEEPMEAAILDGCIGLNKVTKIIVPLMRPTIFVCVFLSITEALNMFPLLMTLTNGGPGHASQNISLYIYTEAFKSHRMAYASAMAVILTLIMLVVTALQQKLTKGDDY